ncbi:YdiU family protein [Vibrio profundum]|uniref:protein adenylyltransferase SelO n=1 Tax=Vibrio profundum TaxID=2910247 RepID=UPI003D0C4DF8
MSIWDALPITNRYSGLSKAFYTLVSPQPLDNPRWLIWNSALAASFGLPAESELPEGLLSELDGSALPSQFYPLAMKYAGHQFGSYNPDLGDGRGLLLAELADKEGTVYDIHLKGAGMTPYSRMGDGRAVLRSTVREYLCSEAMAALSIPTTRALAIIDSDTPVYRETTERGALLIRLAETHIRFGHFEHFYYTNQISELTLLADKAIEWCYPQCQGTPQPYAALLLNIVTKTAEMIAQWQAVGFAHGVMNTDNMSILGHTFDYGPFGFLDDFEPNYICNHSDFQGRYAFNQQPSIALWNLSALAQSLSPLISKQDIDFALQQFEPLFIKHYRHIIGAKLGWAEHHEGDSKLINDLFALLTQDSVDYTNFFRLLSNLDEQGTQPVLDLFGSQQACTQWLENYQTRCLLEHPGKDNYTVAQDRCVEMRRRNPKYILRNYLAQQAIEKAERGDYQELHRLSALLARPYDEHSEFSHYASAPPDWGRKLAISCSS